MIDETSKQRVKELCDLIAKEQDHQRFSVLVAELNQLLDGFDPTINRDSKEDTSPSASKRS
jgi:hypothetical protein